MTHHASQRVGSVSPRRNSHELQSRNHAFSAEQGGQGCIIRGKFHCAGRTAENKGHEAIVAVRGGPSYTISTGNRHFNL